MGIKEKLNKASVLYKQKKFDSANEILKKLLKKNPKLFDALQLMALTLHGMKRFDEAIELFNKVITKNPQHVESVNNLANVYSDMGQLKLAESTYLKAININNAYGDALNNLANVQRKLGDYISAEKNYNKAVLCEPSKAEYYLNLGVLFSERGLFELALNVQLKVLELDPSQSIVYFHIFNNFMFLHRYQDALEFADLGLINHQLNDFQLCELLIGKAILFWLSGNDDEGLEALALSEMIHRINSENINLKNHRVFHNLLKYLYRYRQTNRQVYEANELPTIYFISESHGFSANGITVEHENEKHKIKSLFITGAKIFHFTKNDEHKCKASLNVLLSNLPKGSTLALGFGEIDCRINEGVLKYSVKYNKNPLSIIDDMLEKYIAILNNAASLREYSLIIYGVPSPHPLVVEGLTKEQAEEFKNLVFHFNHQLYLQCKKSEIPFLDVYKLTNNNGVSNLKYHNDYVHVKPETLPKLFELLSEV